MLTLVWLCLLGQTNESFQQPQIHETFKVTLHQLHVKVSDKNGNPVTGLAAEDFSVALNGEGQEVTSVREILLDGSGPEPEQGKRAFLFVFDLEHLGGGLATARADTIRFVEEEMSGGDLAAVFVFNSSSIIMASNLTADKNALVRAVKTFGYEAVAEGAEEEGYSAKSVFRGTRKNIITNNELSGLSVGGEPVAYVQEGLKNVQLESGRGQVLAYLTQFQEFAEYLKVMEGTKNLVLFSRGLGGRLTERVGNVMSTSRRVVEALQASGAVVYIVDPGQAKGARTGGMPVFNELSKATGGRAFSRVDDTLDALKTIKKLTNHYYLVNIQTDLDTPKGEMVGVKVKVNRPDVKVQTGKGLVLRPDHGNLSPLEQNMAMTNLMARDRASNYLPISLDVHVLPGVDDKVRLNLVMDMEGEFLLYHGNPGQSLEFEVMTAAIERDTQALADNRYQKISLNPREMQGVLKESGFKYFADLMVRPGRYKVKLVVRDMDSGMSSTVIRNLDIMDDPQFAGPVLTTDQQWVVVHVPREGVETKMDRYAYAFGEQRFLPKAEDRISPDDITRMLFLFKDRPEMKKSDLSVALMIAEKDGGIQAATARSMTYRVLQDMDSPYAGLLVSLDTKAFKFNEEKDYRLFTRINFKDQAPIISEYAFQIGDEI